MPLANEFPGHRHGYFRLFGEMQKSGKLISLDLTL